MKIAKGNGQDCWGLSGDYIYFFRGLTPEQEIKLLKYFGKKELGKKPTFWEKTPYQGEFKDNVRIYLKADYHEQKEK